jgi:hypothetical protein
LWLDCADLDEALYPLPGLISYKAEMLETKGRDALVLTLYMWDTAEEAAQAARIALGQIPALRAVLFLGNFDLDVILLENEKRPFTGVAKTSILDSRNGGTRQ